MNIAVTRSIIAGIYETILLLSGYIHSEETLLETCAEKYEYRRKIGADIL